MSYKDVVIPDGKSKKKYTAQERRHDLLKLICENGHPSVIHQSEICKEYGVTQSMISKDIEAIRKDITKHLGNDADLIIESVMTKSITELQKKGRHFESARVAEMLGKWFFNRGAIDKAPEKVEINADSTIEKLQSYYEEEIKGRRSKKDNKKQRR